jgi:hypothetical protein
MLAAALSVIALTTLLGACGRRNPPRPPEGRESEYTFPRFYPAPATVLPAAPGGARTGAGDEVEDDTEPEDDIRKLSPIPPSSSRTTTKTYGPPPE